MTNNHVSDQVRQTLLAGFVGTDAAAVAPFIEELRPAGVALLPRNIQSAAQVSDLCGGLQELARASGLPPLLIAVDQEGGAVARLSSAAGFTDLPGAMAVALAGDRDAARELAAMAGRELAAVGINMDLAPVADLALDRRNSVIGTRSFGADPIIVSSLVTAYIEGLRSAGVLACAKHFPGHGATHVDSHLALPRLEASLDELEARDLEPFRAAIAARCAGIMTAHVVSSFDAGRPATLSQLTLTGLLRHRLGFDGLVLTDALEMKALANTGLEPWETAVEALRAGADMVVFEGDLPLIRRSLAWMDRAIERDQLDVVPLASTARRLAAARQALNPPGHPSTVATADHQRLAFRAAVDGLLIEDPASVLPLASEPVVLDVGRGREFAAAVGWPLAQGPSVPDGKAAVVVADGEEDSSAVPARATASAGGSVIVVVLRGWTVPDGLPGSAATVLALDLPMGLWPAITARLTGRASAVAPRPA